MIKEFTEKIAAGSSLSIDEAFDSMSLIMNGEESPVQTAGFLVALKCKGESFEEVAGFAKAMREKSIKIKADDADVIDVCGTGGDSSGTFNISTAAAFIAAGAGITAAKHGNRSVSSSSGSADVLQELGIKIDLGPAESEKVLNEIGIAFLFAPVYHPAMKHAAPVRKELGMRTVFNILGPLTNPAQTKRQMIGVFSEDAAKIMVKSAELLSMEKVCFVCTEGKYDEVLLHAPVQVFEYSSEFGHKQYEINNESFGFAPVQLDQIIGGTPKDNAVILQRIFNGREKDGCYYTAAANAAMGLYCAGLSNDLKECAEAAEDSILSGKAMQKLEQLRNFGK